MYKATFVLSSGRCGTQWLARMVAEAYGDLIQAVHEPLFFHYRPREFLSAGDPARLSDSSKILRHLEAVEARLEDGPYLETGWPCYGALPYLMEHLAGRIRVVHLTRHPVTTASSMMTHRYYSDPPRFDHLAELGLLTPFDAGVRLAALGDRWPDMKPFERCLYFWAEIQAIGIAMAEEGTAPMIRISSEGLFAGDDLARLLAFLELPVRPEILESRKTRVDRHHYRSPEAWRVEAIERFPEFVAIAERLGYEVGDIDPASIAGRYRDVRRNAPCPCGSGRRFKNCHGAYSQAARSTSHRRATRAPTPQDPRGARGPARPARG